MNPILEAKYNELTNAGDYECWYLVKQPTAFDCLCYLVSFLKDYQDANTGGNLQEHIERCVNRLHQAKPSIEISNNYRALRVAAFFGLITMRSKGYNDAIITPTYYEICKRCNSEFEQTDKYADIIDRQIEKMFLSSEIDEGKDGTRKNFRLYPVMLLYKVLIELGRTTGNYRIDMTEYRYLVATTKSFSDFLDALLLIKLMRQEPDCKPQFEAYRTKFDNRLIQALKQLRTLIVDRDSISLNPEMIDDVAQKVFIFESNPEMFATESYLTFLGSTQSLISLDSKADDDTTVELSEEWFKKQAASMATIDQEADELYKEFQAHFAPEVLKQMSGVDMLDKLFYSEHRAEHNLCHTLEHDTRYQLFGGIKGGSAYKFGLFYSKEHSSWITGSPKKVRKLSEDDAIELGSSIRDELVAGAEVIANYGELNDLNDYADLYAQVFKVMPNLINKMWAMKYLHMIFPDIFPVFYSGEWQNSVLNKLGIEPKEESFIRMGQIALFVKKCGITNVAFSKVIYKLKADPSTDSEEETEEQTIPTYTFDTTKGGAQNRVVYGTPGCGKSFYVQNTYLAKCGIANEHRIRTTFYMDYTNTDFVGQILPKVKPNGEVTYDFNPGPFALAMRTAIENPDVAVALIIEELNRGNAASIFGDIFQLLDRDASGKSQYSITNVNLQDYLNKCFEGVYTFNSISIPANLYIVATMNTSDQNVFTLDTAFKRRWQFEKLRNEFTLEHKYKDYFVPGMDGVTWEALVTAINKYIVDRPDDLASEDKQLGVYFIEKETLCATAEECSDETKINRFAFKLFEYLWDDVAKYAHSDWFAAEIKTLDDLIDAYKRLGVKVFADGVLNL